MLKNLNYGPFLIIFAAILWALDGVLRRTLFSLPPITIVFYEHLTGLLILSPFLLPKLRDLRLDKKTVSLIFLVSLLSGVLGTLWFTTALLKVNFISFSVVYLLQKLQPVFAITTAVIFLKEKMNQKYLLWAAIALISAYFVTFKNGVVNFATGAGTIEAALFAFGAAAAWGSSTTISKRLLIKNQNTLITGLRFLTTTILALIFVFSMGAAPSLSSPSPNQYLTFVLIALSTGMFALWVYYKGLRTTQVKVATILELAFPILAIFIDAIVYNSRLAPAQLLAAAILLFSIFQISKLQSENKI